MNFDHTVGQRAVLSTLEKATTKMDEFGELLHYHLAAVPDLAMLVLIGTGVAGLGMLWRRYVHRRGTRHEGAPRGRKPSAVRNGSSPNDA
jgi:hypothetical protein